MRDKSVTRFGATDHTVLALTGVAPKRIGVLGVKARGRVMDQIGTAASLGADYGLWGADGAFGRV
jgi:hypothetical protein